MKKFAALVLMSLALSTPSQAFVGFLNPYSNALYVGFSFIGSSAAGFIYGADARRFGQPSAPFFVGATTALVLGIVFLPAEGSFEFAEIAPEQAEALVPGLDGERLESYNEIVPQLNLAGDQVLADLRRARKADPKLAAQLWKRYTAGIDASALATAGEILKASSK
jgi:hypothetical protein